MPNSCPAKLQALSATEVPGSQVILFYGPSDELASVGSINPCPAEPRHTLPLQTVQIQISWLTLFVIKYLNLYEKLGSSNLIGWKLEMGMASQFIQNDKG